MLRKKNDERLEERGDVAVMVETTSSTTRERRKLPKLPLLGGGAFLLLGLWAASSTAGGALASVYVYAFLNFFAGVFTLVALSVTVMAGLVATDRIFLKIGHRVLFQGLHRATAIIAIISLGLHVSMKIMEGTATVLDPFVPFGNLANPMYVGLGTIASYLMISVFWTGIIRAKFAGSGRPWMWRALHSGAYLAWPIALGHGLNAGRPAATWVVLSYGACVVGVAIALLVRLYVMLGRRTTGTTTGPKAGVAAVGVNVETAVMPRITDSMMPPRAARAAEPELEPVGASTRETRIVKRDTMAGAPRERSGSGRQRQGYAVPPEEETRRGRSAARWDEEPAAARSGGRGGRAAKDRTAEDELRWSTDMEARGERRGRSAEGRDRRSAEGRPAEGRSAEGRGGRGAESAERRSRTAEPDAKRGRRRDQAEDGVDWYERLREQPAERDAERDRYSRPREDEYASRRSASRRGDPEPERWTSPADERYGSAAAREDSGRRREESGRGGRRERSSRRDEPVEPVSGSRWDAERPVSGARWDSPDRPVSGDRWDAPVSGERWDTPVSGARWDSPDRPVSGERWERPEPVEERPRRGLRLVRDDESESPRRRSRSARHSQSDEYEMEQPRERRTGRLGPYPPAPATDMIDSADRPRRGRRAAGGEDLDVGTGEYWTQPRGGYGR
ncbi:hypothetical protein [Micromonospora sp. CPCC 206061]|uniref:hypothetical protein n=1 Tax=Micromonospora sp. CPCC 206061 TaxID=3122410 RepID=UPI002FF3EF9D